MQNIYNMLSINTVDHHQIVDHCYHGRSRAHSNNIKPFSLYISKDIHLRQFCHSLTPFKMGTYLIAEGLNTAREQNTCGLLSKIKFRVAVSLLQLGSRVGRRRRIRTQRRPIITPYSETSYFRAILQKHYAQVCTK